MSNKIWQNFGALNKTEGHVAQVEDEFKEDLPFEANDKGLLEAKAPRRDFLKYLGFSTAAATVAASCEIPVKKAIPFVNKPDNLIPGVANYYATTYVQDGDVLSVVAKVRDGRPIKIEGNELSPITQGGTSARAQASVLDLYDTARLRFPAQVKDKKIVEVSTFDAFDKMISEGLAGLNGAPVVILTGTITSPSTKQLIGEFIAKYPGSRHVTYDAVSNSALLLANEASYGKKAIPSYHFDKANTIVSLGADFLGTWVSPVEFSKQYAIGRKLDEQKMTLSKHYQFESILSMTGANADERFTHRPSEAGAVAAALLAAVTGGPVSVADAQLKAGLEKAAKDLKAAQGAALVVSGSNDVNVQLIVNAINEAIGANGTTINWGVTSNYRQGIDSDMTTLVADMNAGKVGALFIAGANPAYTYAAADQFIAGLAKTKLTVSFNPKLDETTELCKFSVPDHHYLESWGDAEAKTGYISFIQPTISPLFKTRQFQDSLLKWSGNTSDYVTYLKAFWMTKLGSQEVWDKALRDGVVSPAALPVATAAFNSGVVAAAVTAATAAKKGGAWEVELYQKTAIGSGSQANNPWLQEAPDPITKATWDNYAMISAAAAKELLGIDLTDNGDADSYEVNPKKPVIKIKANGKEIDLAVIIVPGTQKNTIGIALGYGQSEKVGIAVRGAGKNAYPFTSISNGAVSYTVADAAVTVTGELYEIAQNQTHNSYEGRVEVVKETSLKTFKQHPEMFKAQRDALVEDYAGKTGDYRNEGSLYDPRLNDRPGIHWGMSIDLNSCTGCMACVVACNAENNIPVVGKTEVLRGHDMHWLRIDRYYISDEKNPDELKDVVFMPMLCQHCDNAPCENVCPVAATNHSSEGLNQMTYNRCIGTRYCANNCPYKVRRFNWADYTGADSFPDNQVGHISDVTLEMNDDLYRMVLNPDVTVRSRGVIEKCSFCVQRLQEGKLNAKKENRPIKDGEVKAACQQACASGCITFGDANDKKSAVHNEREHNPLRMYYALEQIHVLPNVNYMAKIRNTEELIAVEGEAAAPAAHEAAH
ncbi:MAG TPA: TAT-variant-translocated molybdopterin oxidoreductase [Phnomibacter sp.]|nr:TAT-variant-translocated molybdopterin oxidoreductase [Phnomibacter sp.]